MRLYDIVNGMKDVKAFHRIVEYYAECGVAYL
jgi:hypothetical protein